LSCGIKFLSETNIPKRLKKKFWWVEENFCSYGCLLKKHHYKKTNRSNSEELVYQALRREISDDYRIFKNDRTQIGLELDFYIPSIKVGIEINGPVHRRNIYGKENLKKVQKNDRIRKSLCESKGIKLIVIDIEWVKNDEEAKEIVASLLEDHPVFTPIRKSL